MDNERLIDFLEWSLSQPRLSCGLLVNAETLEAMEAASRGEFSGSFNTVEELMADLISNEDK